MFSRVVRILRRRWILWPTVFLFTIVVLWFVFGLYLLFYPLGVIPKLVDYPPRFDSEPFGNPETVELLGPTLFIADIHLTHEEEPSRLSGLFQFVSARSVRNLVVVGDLFDSPNDAREILGSSKGEDAVSSIFRFLGLNDNGSMIFFVRGSPTHDPEEFNLDFEDDGFDCDRWRRALTQPLFVAGEG
jgi:hypothetical protein